VDFSYRRFELPGRIRASGPLNVRADTPLGLALLKKSIDRLESTLFIQPDRGDAAFALGFCYSFHYEGIWNPDRADELPGPVLMENSERPHCVCWPKSVFTIRGGAFQTASENGLSNRNSMHSSTSQKNTATLCGHVFRHTSRETCRDCVTRR